jgi:hypothetical protein
MADFYGLSEEVILARIEDGETLTSIATSVKCSKSMISRWLHAEPERSARANLSRIAAAAAWDELAEQEIRKAADGFDLAKAKELAHHFRWRASKISPAAYGDKIEQIHRGAQPVYIDEKLAAT